MGLDCSLNCRLDSDSHCFSLGQNVAGRKRLVLENDEIFEIYEYLNNLEFLRVKEEECLKMFLTSGLENLTQEQLELVKAVRNQKAETVKNFELLEEIRLKNTRSKIENEILTLSEKDDRQSFFDLLKDLNNLRKGLDQLQKVKRSNADREEKKQASVTSQKKKNDSKKYFLGDLLQKWMNSKFNELNDDQVLDVLKNMMENERIGMIVRKQWTDKNQNIDWMHQRITEIQKITHQVDAAKTDPRNPFKSPNKN